MKKHYDPHVELIRIALQAINQYRPDDNEAFLQQQMAQDDILMRLQETGENLARIRNMDEDRFNEFADTSWLKLIGLRNVISHGYHTINPARTWTIITDELADFAASLDSLPRR